MDQKKAANEASTQNNSTDKQVTKNILFFGNSLTAGYGLEDPSSESFPSLIQEKIDSLKLNYKAINAGLSGETTAGGKGRIGWLLRTQVDVFVLELGANDGLRGLPVTETIKNLQSIVDTVKAKYPDAKLVLLGMKVPPNMGGRYAADFNAVFKTIADKNSMLLVPFLLENVAGIPKLNLKDGVHPTAPGQKIVAENVWKELKNIL
ncbi:Arylesterase precursor [Arcticibacter svalbardensis MN12-7]|uniref:Arylesterase n=2 Tax=Arcticibacter TaxID=1288026 RepID=R9GX78_9SPHI|nr:Arylesterase precursor [Arcticibacter svalbardensis MN12-7]